MYAVIETGGKQYKVAKDQVVEVEKVNGKTGEAVTFEQVLLTSINNKVTVGRPTVPGAQVTATILAQKKAPKIIAFKYKRRKGYHRKVGHRQQLTAVKITDISAK